VKPANLPNTAPLDIGEHWPEEYCIVVVAMRAAGTRRRAVCSNDNTASLT